MIGQQNRSQRIPGLNNIELPLISTNTSSSVFICEVFADTATIKILKQKLDKTTRALNSKSDVFCSDETFEIPGIMYGRFYLSNINVKPFFDSIDSHKLGISNSWRVEITYQSALEFCGHKASLA